MRWWRYSSRLTRWRPPGPPDDLPTPRHLTVPRISESRCIGASEEPILRRRFTPDKPLPHRRRLEERWIVRRHRPHIPPVPIQLPRRLRRARPTRVKQPRRGRVREPVDRHLRLRRRHLRLVRHLRRREPSTTVATASSIREAAASTIASAANASAAIPPTTCSTWTSSTGASAEACPNERTRRRTSAAASRPTARSTPAVTACSNSWRNAPITVVGSGWPTGPQSWNPSGST